MWERLSRIQAGYFLSYSLIVLVELMIIDGRAQEQRDLFFLLFLSFQQLALGSFPIMSTQQDWEQKIHSI